MAGKILEYELTYHEEGDEIKETLNIDFVSNWCIREINKVMQATFEIKKDWDLVSDLTTDIAALQTERPEGYREEVNKINEEITRLTENILKFNQSGLLDERFEVLKQLLEDNGYKDTKFILYEFWDRQVDPAIFIDFLMQCAWKDIQDKKKVKTQ